MTSALILNLVLATAVMATIVGLIAWGIATAYRDRGVTLVRRSRRHPRPALARQRFEPVPSRR
jgi:hypothetical protein